MMQQGEVGLKGDCEGKKRSKTDEEKQRKEKKGTGMPPTSDTASHNTHKHTITYARDGE